MNESPTLSVVVAASDSALAVEETLASLRDQGEAERVQVIVAAARDRIAPPGLHDGVIWVSAEAGSGVARLRRLGLDVATAPIVIFTEDSCRFGPGWLSAWSEAFRDPRVAAATGPVVPAMGDALVDWAVFFCEYAPFLEGRWGRGEPPGRLAGNNFAVRQPLGEVARRSEIHESDVAIALGRFGARVVEATSARARHVRRYEMREAIRDRLRFGREFGRMRAGRHARTSRIAAVFAGPLILAVQAIRLSAIVATRCRHIGPFLESLPVTLALLSAWSVGEWGGWVVGPARAEAGCK